MAEVMVDVKRVGGLALFCVSSGYVPAGFGDFNVDQVPDLMVLDPARRTVGAYLLGRAAS